MTDNSPKALVLKAFEGFDGTSDAIDRLIECFAAAVVFDLAPTDVLPQWRRFEGRAALRAFMTYVFGLGSDIRLVIRETVEEGDTVATFTTQFATQNVELHGLPAGSKTRTESAVILRVREGLIGEVKWYMGLHALDDDAPGEDHP